MALTATQLKAIQLKIMDIFRTGGRTTLHRAPMPEFAQQLFDHQTASVKGIVPNETCVDVEVGYLTDDVTSLPSVSGTPAAVTCAITGGDGVSSAIKTYAPNMYIKKTLNANTKDCDNIFKFGDKAAHTMASGMHLIARAINEHIINQVNTNRQTPTFAGRNGTINVDLIDFGTADETPDMLADFREVALRHDLSNDFLIFNGGNFGQVFYNAGFNQLNDDQRDQIAKLQAGQKMLFDVRNMDVVLGTNSTFLVDPHMVAFANRWEYPTTPTDPQGAENNIQFSTPLMYFVDAVDPGERVRTMTYQSTDRNGNVTQIPIMIDVDLQRVCNSTITSGGRRSYDWKWEFKVEAMFDIAPATAGTGIIKYNRV